jgi:hypothetical protein
MKIVVHREFNWSRPRSVLSFNLKPSPVPRSVVHDLGEAAVAAGAATRVRAPRTT